jgi:hypothetical protein
MTYPRQSNNLFSSCLLAYWVGLASMFYVTSASAFLGIGDPKVEVTTPNEAVEKPDSAPLEATRSDFFRRLR